MDVTVAWTIDPNAAPRLLQNVGTSTDEVKEKLVRPMARTLVRDVLNELDSEAVYNSDKRFQKAEKARQVLSDALSPFGVQVAQVILHEHRFNPEYEQVIHDRKLAEQRAEQLKSEAEAANQEALRNLETARGKVASDIAAADGNLQQNKLSRTPLTSPSSRTPTPSWPSAPRTPRQSPSATRRCAARAGAPWSSSRLPRRCRASR